MPLRPLDGFVIGITADRRKKEQAQLLERRGACVLQGPTISTRYLAFEDELRAATLELIARPPAYLVAITGVGMRAWFEAAQAWDLAEELLGALNGTRIVARGPKAAGAVLATGLTIWARAPSEQLDEVLDLLSREPLAGKTVAVQQHGAESPELTAALADAGAHVVEAHVYRWRLPDDPSDARRLIGAIGEGRVDAVTFTSAPAVHSLFAIAAQEGGEDRVRQAFNGRVVAACVGAVCAEAARCEGIEAPLVPATGRLGLLVRALSDHFCQTRRTLRLHGSELTIQGNVIVTDQERVELTPRERAVLDQLAARPGAVVSRAALLKSVWGSARDDPHVLQMTVTRLRAKLGPFRNALRTSPGRGYCLDLSAGESRSSTTSRL